VTISAEESGVVREILVDKGNPVREGQAIARIDDRILSAQVDQARAQSALAGETWERRKRLFEEDQVGSELAYLEARYAAEQSRANLSALKERLERTVIRAPIEGILDSRSFEVGTMVSPGMEVARIVDLDPVKVVGGVPERFAADVRRGARATVTFDVLRGERFPANISYVGSAVNPRNRTFPAELSMPNPRGIVKPEMVANIEIVRHVHEDVVVIPQEALIRVEEGFVAFVVEEENGREVARSRALTLGPSQRNRVVIERGIEPGDRLIVVGQQQVAAGDRVQVVGANRRGADR
jgi:membrane fusion protein, multidrug efflux system